MKSFRWLIFSNRPLTFLSPSGYQFYSSISKEKKKRKKREEWLAKIKFHPCHVWRIYFIYYFIHYNSAISRRGKRKTKDYALDIYIYVYIPR